MESQNNISPHVAVLRNFLRYTLKKFYYLNGLCSTILLRSIFYGLVQSRIKFPITCWGGTFKNRVHPILVLQKLIIQKICRKPLRSLSSNLFFQLKLYLVRHLYVFKVLRTFSMQSKNRNLRLISALN